MRRTRIFSVIVFLVAVVSFGFFQYRNYVLTDNQSPKIKIETGSIEVSVNASEEELLAGITATDDRDGDVTDSLLIESIGNFIEPNCRRVTIAASDSSGNVAKASREIVYTDYEEPQFALEGALRFPVGVTNVLTNLTASDALDGDLTAKIKVSTEYAIAADVAGDYPMEFSVTNSAGDVVKLPVTVTVYDQAEENRRPQIELTQYIVYTKVGHQVKPWKYVSKITTGGKEYERDGDLLRDMNAAENQARYSIRSSEVDVDSNADYSKPGTYEITYRFGEEDAEAEEIGSVRLIVVVTE